MAVRDWRGGSYGATSDDQLLSAATADLRVLVTYDCQTIPPLLKEWAETGRHHAGVVLIDEKTLSPRDIGGLVRALSRLSADRGGQTWTDRVVYLRAARDPASPPL